jgi:hypothetical protein
MNGPPRSRTGSSEDERQVLIALRERLNAAVGE